MLKARWAIDPLLENDHSELITSFASALNQRKPIKVIPTSVLGSIIRGWFMELPERAVNTLWENAQRSVEKKLKPIQSELIRDPEFLLSGSSDEEGDVAYLCNFLKKDDSDFVILMSHARKGLSRAFLGSFAESLMLQSQSQFLFLTPNMKPTQTLDTFLYPTDFSGSSKWALESLLETFSGVPKKLILYSKAMYPIENFTPIEFLESRFTVGEVVDRITKERKERSQAWSEIGERFGVELTTIVDGELDNLVDDIGRTCESENVDLVLMPSFVSRSDMFFTGSLAREAVRNLNRPVFTKHFFAE